MLKEFLCYQRISIKEGLDIESEKPHLEKYDITKSGKCRLCCQIFITKKVFKDNDNDRNQYFKIMNNITKTGRMYVIWNGNIKYRVYTDLYQTNANNIMKAKDAKDLHCLINDSNVIIQNISLVVML